MKKIAIVVQRYGTEVNGGAEVHAKMLAEKFSEKYIVHVLTTTALEYKNWAPYYKVGEEVINNVVVKRFHTFENDKSKARKFRNIVFEKRLTDKLLKKAGLYNYLCNIYPSLAPSDADCEQWLIHQGPYCPALTDYIRKYKDEYDYFIFMTYLFYPTVTGIPYVKEKSILIPTAHNEKALYTKPYKNLFDQPSYIMYNTTAEKELIQKKFPNITCKYDVAGLGVEKETELGNNSFNIPVGLDYILYIGRIDKKKGCAELIHHFIQYKKRHQCATKLILVGNNNFGRVMRHEYLLYTGFISAPEKAYLLQHCKALIMPSKYESLSLVTLEAMSHGKIVIANGQCDVLKEHIQKSHAGFCYSGYKEFANCLKWVLSMSKEEEKNYASNGVSYVSQHYAWHVILKKFDQAFLYIDNH